MLPGALAGLAHDRQPLDLVTPQAGVEHGRDCGQQVAYCVGHPADVRLLHGVSVGGQAAGQLGLAQGGAAFQFVELARFLDAQSALDEGEATAQFVFRKMPGERDDLATLGPRAEQA